VGRGQDGHDERWLDVPEPKQDRAVRTRQAILMAAAKVTKGALYFHFNSKEELAEGVLSGQDQLLQVPVRACKTQELVDTTMVHAYRLQTDPMVRAGVRLALDQRAANLDRSGPFRRWGDIALDLLGKAQAQGELLPHVVPAETAEVMVGAFAGVQAMSQVVCDYQDLQSRVSALLRHLLPSVVLSSVLASVDLTERRGEAVYSESYPREPVPVS
jgi:AcrR family transcriptional regulator